jgi:predicted RNA-binding protein with PUA-like domain
VDLAPLKTLLKPVSLETIKVDQTLKEMALLGNSRLSVTPLTKEQFERLLTLAETKVAF